MNLRRRHLLRDLFFLSLPFAGLSVYLWLAAITGFWNAEVVNFSGYPVRNIRVANFGTFVEEAVRPLRQPLGRDFLPRDGLRGPVDEERSVPLVEMMVAGNDLDRLDSALPASGKEWVPAVLRPEPQAPWQEIEARHRGQRLDNFFWRIRSWKLKTDNLELVDFQRELNYTPIAGRLDNHLSNLVGRRLGIATPHSRLVQLVVNREDQGLFLQEEQVDESMMRAAGHMPGDVFYGDLFVPDEPHRGSDDLFGNPYAWDKKAVYNKFPEEFRPHLTRLLTLVSDRSRDSWDELYRLFDYDELVRYFALLCYQGDQHVDRSHNHKLFFDPLAGRFVPLPWNVRMNMPRGHGVETMANRLAEKLVRDPRFLDDVHRVISEELLAPRGRRGSIADEQLAELARIREQIEEYSIHRERDLEYIAAMEQTVRAREETVRRHHGRAVVRWRQLDAADGLRKLRLATESVASLGVSALHFTVEPGEFRIIEDRDGNGRVSAGEPSLPFVREGRAVRLERPVVLYPGRDLRAPYQQPGGRDFGAVFRTHRQFTRLASLRSDLLLVPTSAGTTIPTVAAVDVQRRIGSGDVDVAEGPPSAALARATLHPWTAPAATEPSVHHFAGEAVLEETLIVGPRDRFHAEPGTVLRLAPGVSILIHSRVQLDRVTIRRLDPALPWGMFGLQGEAASHSLLRDCDFEGGSQDRLDFVDYSGMLSVYGAHGVSVQGGRYSANVLGDDTIRFAHCRGLRIDGVTVEDANGDAIDCDLSTGTIADTKLVAPRNDGVDLMTARVYLEGIEVYGAGDKGLSLGEGAHPRVEDVWIENCVTGIAIKDGSDPTIVGATIRGCETAVAAYDKNWRYFGGGRGRLVRSRLEDNQLDIRLDARSQLQLQDTPVRGRIELPSGPREQWLRSISTAPGGTRP